MLQHFKLGIVLAAFLVSPSMALAQTTPSTTPVSPADQTSDLNSTERNAQPASGATAQQSPESQRPVCPAGYFASKFPDVTPSDWAYEAVNRLADREFRCFPLSSQ